MQLGMKSSHSYSKIDMNGSAREYIGLLVSGNVTSNGRDAIMVGSITNVLSLYEAKE